MHDVAIVSTFAKDHIPLYGNKFVETVNKYWSSPLYLYAEDFSSDDLLSKSPVLDYYTHIPQQKTFKDHIIKELKNVSTKPANRLKKALRWSYKSFVILHGLENIDCKYLIWMDADVETLKEIPNDLVRTINQNKLLTAYPQHIKGELHIESGLIIFNKQHSLIESVIEHYRNGYINKHVLSLTKPWDGFWLAEFLKDPQHKKESNLIQGPFLNVRPYLHHHVGKNKFRNTELDKFSGRKSLTL